MSLYRDRGIVLRTIRLGEADRIITFMTERNGKVRAVAKGVRKTKSKFGGRLEPTSHIAVQFYEGRGDLDIVTQAETIDMFPNTRSDLDRMTKAIPLLEAIDQISPDKEENPALYKMLLGALRSLDEQDSAVLVAAFFLKLLAAEGFRPVVGGCVECDSSEDLVSFDPDAGGVLCRQHRRGMPLSPEALAILRRVLGGGLASALEIDESPATHEVESIATALMEHHLERRLRSVKVF